jgi:hypothetical protein
MRNFPDSRGMKDLGYRTILAIPLLREGNAIGRDHDPADRRAALR